MQPPFKSLAEKSLPSSLLPHSLLAPTQHLQERSRAHPFSQLPSDDVAPFRALNRQQFADLVRDYNWSRRIWRVDMHHTWYPNHASYVGLSSIERMDRYHREERGFDCIAQHVTIAPDGTIWTGRNWNKTPASVGFGMNEGVFMFEVIGNFDDGHDRLEGAQLASVVTVIETVQARFRLPVQALLFHHEVPQTEKTCPGTSIEKMELLRRVKAKRTGNDHFALA
jgi:N-acetylmuramoyl-L-alanine amidase